jgi:hypothetical protein
MRKLVLTAALALVVVAPAQAARVSRAERLAIDTTLNGFVNHAVKREGVDAAWSLVTPQMRAGITRAEWDKGNVPVTPYAAGGTKFDQWTPVFVSRREVDFNLMIPGRKKDDSIQFNGTMKKIGKRWLVDSFEPSATFGGGAVVGTHDFTAGEGGSGGGVATLGKSWILLPVGIFVLGVLAVVGWLLYGMYRNRRAYREYRNRPLEPLVRKERNGTDPARARERERV